MPLHHTLRVQQRQMVARVDHLLCCQTRRCRVQCPRCQLFQDGGQNGFGTFPRPPASATPCQRSELQISNKQCNQSEHKERGAAQRETETHVCALDCRVSTYPLAWTPSISVMLSSHKRQSHLDTVRREREKNLTKHLFSVLQLVNSFVQPLSNTLFVEVCKSSTDGDKKVVGMNSRLTRTLNKAPIITGLGFTSCYLLTGLSTSETKFCLST